MMVVDMKTELMWIGILSAIGCAITASMMVIGNIRNDYLMICFVIFMIIANLSSGFLAVQSCSYG